ncbi:hypothetical protein BGZ98_009241 [Dissophora globulifera]|nr:hypothetical protein BGZ98_009241 [Dissophora globulifera]
MAQPEQLLAIDDLFIKAAHIPASSSSPSSAITSGSTSHTHRHGRILSFVGQVVHSVRASQVSTDAPSLEPTSFSKSIPNNTVSASTVVRLSIPQNDPDRHPLHRQAIWLFQKKYNGQPPDHIVWLAAATEPLSEEARLDLASSARDLHYSRSRSTAGKSNQRFDITDNVAFRDINDHATNPKAADVNMPQGNYLHETASDHKDRGRDSEDDASAVSWSDSNASNADDDEENPPPRMIAVLLSDSFHQKSDSENNNSTSAGSASEIRFNPGDRVEVFKAVMLVETVLDQRVVLSCVGIPERTTFRIIPASHSLGAGESGEKNTQSTRINRHSREIPIIAQEQRLGAARKRSRSTNSSIPNPGSQKIRKSKRENLEINRLPTPLPVLMQPQVRQQETNPLNLLVRKSDKDCTRGARGWTGSGGADNGAITYFADLWSNITQETTTAANTPVASRSGTPALYSSPSEANVAGHSFAKVKSQGPTRHVCWLTGIQSALIRAVCASCGNDYKNLNCTFGCSPRTWRLDIRIECSVSDGTAEAQLLVLRDHEEVMWTLLGLRVTTSGGIENNTEQVTLTSTSSSCHSMDAGASESYRVSAQPVTPAFDPHQDIKNRILRIVARRGELSFKVNIETYGYRQSEDSMAGFHQAGGYVDIMHQDRSQRAKTEEKLWMDLCTACSPRRETFLLHAMTASSSIMGTSTPASATTTDAIPDVAKSAQLTVKFVRMNRQATIQTLVPPPLTLHAIHVDRIRPQTEAKMLLRQLISPSPHPTINRKLA